MIAQTVFRPASGPTAPTTLLQRKCACGKAASGLTGQCGTCQRERLFGLQARLAVGAADDPLEREADAVAERVVRDERPAPRARPALRPAIPEGNGGIEAPPVVNAVLRSPGRALEPSLRAFFEPRFGHDFGSVRVHTDPRASASAQDIGARAYTTAGHMVFAAGQYAPDTRAGRRLLAHELTHVIQQRGTGGGASPAPLRRAITFEGGTAEARHSVVDPKTKAEGLSPALLEQFKTGAFEFLALKLSTRTEDGDVTVAGAAVDTAQEKVIEGKFAANYKDPVSVVETQRKDSGFEDVRKVVTKDAAMKTWRDIQSQVKDRATSRLSGVVVRAPSSATEKLRHELTQSPAIADEATVGADVVTIDRKAWEGLVVRSDTAEAFDGFWILLHEMRHLAGKEDATVGPGMYATPVTQTRKQKLGGRQSARELTLIGEAVSELNVLRIGLGLPFRTNYADDGILYFGGLGGKGEETAGAFLSGESKSEREARGATPPLVSDRLAEEQRKKEEKKEKVVGFWAKRLETVEKGTLYSHGSRPVRMRVSVAGDQLSGSYDYITSTGNSVSGRLTGRVVAEFTDDRSRLGVKVSFTWSQGAEHGFGFWKTTPENIGDQEKSITVATEVPGKWGIKTESSGGDWSIEVPGDIASW